MRLIQGDEDFPWSKSVSSVAFIGEKIENAKGSKNARTICQQKWQIIERYTGVLRNV